MPGEFRLDVGKFLMERAPWLKCVSVPSSQTFSSKAFPHFLPRDVCILLPLLNKLLAGDVAPLWIWLLSPAFEVSAEQEQLGQPELQCLDSPDKKMKENQKSGIRHAF